MTLYTAQPKTVTDFKTLLIQDARKRGVVALQCECCGYKHPLTRLGYGCNAAHPTQDGETCDGWNLKEVLAPIKASA